MDAATLHHNNDAVTGAPEHVSFTSSDDNEEEDSMILLNMLQSCFANSLSLYETDASHVDDDCDDSSKSKSNPPPTNNNHGQQQSQGCVSINDPQQQLVEDDMATINQLACILRMQQDGLTPFGSRDSLVKASHMQQRRPFDKRTSEVAQ
jgi:hypothetical protein